MEVYAMLIQIVEDDRALSEGIALALKEPGMEFVQSTSVRTAKEAFEERMPMLLILDVNLPDGSGYDYLRWVRGVGLGRSEADSKPGCCPWRQGSRKARFQCRRGDGYG